MANVVDRLLLAATLALGGAISRKVVEVDRRMLRLERRTTDAVVADAPPVPAVAPVVAPAPPGPTVASSTAPPAMPLPTGYGLQVAGPEGEGLHIPVCLPPGFELDSLVLRPDVLAVDALRGPAATPPAPPAASPPRTQPRERLPGAVQLVYGEAQPYRTQVDLRPAAPAAERPAAPRASSGSIVSRPA